MQRSYRANACLESTSNDTAYTPLCCCLDNLLPNTQSPDKLGLNNKDISCLIIKYELGALEAMQGFVNCDCNGHCATKGMHACKVVCLQGLLDILYIVWDKFREDSEGLL